MSTPTRAQAGASGRSLQTPRHNYRPPQQLLTTASVGNGLKSATRVAIVPSRKRIIKQDLDDSRQSKPKYVPSDSRPRRPQVPTQKVREAATYDDEMASYLGWDDEFEFGDEYEEFFDQIPPLVPKVISPQERKYQPPPEKKAKNSFSPLTIVSMGKAVIAGRQDATTGSVDIQPLIDKYIAADSTTESEAWLMNIGLCHKMNTLTRDMEKLQQQVNDMSNFLSKEGGMPERTTNGIQKTKKGRPFKSGDITLTSPWPTDDSGGGPTPFGLISAPLPPTPHAFTIPAIYAKNPVDCAAVYTIVLKKGKKRPGMVFLSSFMRHLFAQAIEPPHTHLLTIRVNKRMNTLVDLSEEFTKPIEDFFLAACEVDNGFNYSLAYILREAISYELRELRRAPRKSLEERKMMRVLASFGGGNQSILDDQNDLQDVELDEVDVEQEEKVADEVVIEEEVEEME